MVKGITKNAPFTQEEVKSYAESFSDFSFEVKTLSLLSNLGFKCGHSATYTDPVTKKKRQYDIRASKVTEIRNLGYYQLNLPVECKNIRPQSPLLVHRLPRRKHEATHDLIVNKGTHRLAVKVRQGFSLYKEDSYTGKAVDQLKRGNDSKICGSDSDVFDKISQALSSAYDVICTAAHVGQNSDIVVAAIIPILVIPTGTLWVLDYDELGNKVSGPEQARHTSYYCGHTWFLGGREVLSSYTISHLEIVTADYMQEFVASLYIDKHDLSQLLIEEGVLG